MDPLLLSEKEAQETLGNIGRTKLYELKKAGDLVQVRIGRRSFITTESVHGYVDSLSQAAVAAVSRD